jgi:hypothetical protein
MRVLNPLGVAAPPQRHLAGRPPTLAGQRLGLVHNGKPGGERLLRRTGDRLAAEHGVQSVTFFAKPHPSARGDFGARLPGVVDVAVGALAD